MSDIIEMKTIVDEKEGNDNDDDDEILSDENEIQEYQDIQTQSDEIEPNENSKNVPKETAFFTNHDVNSFKKKKKLKKKSNDTLMDIITSELASAESAVTENLINKVNSFEDQAGFLLDEPAGIEFLQSRRNWGRQSSWLTNYSTGNLNLNPAYPNILDSENSNRILTRYVAPQYELENKVPVKQLAKFLDIKISNLKFKVHHCFSLEKLLSEKLITVYEDYKKIKESLQSLANELKINREAKCNLKNEFETISQNKDNVIFDPTIRKYMAKIIKLNGVKEDFIKKEIEVIDVLSCLWSDIVSIREKQQCISTTVNVIMAGYNGDNGTENEWTEIFNTEFSDLVDKAEFEFVTKYIDYKEDKKRLGSGDRKRLSKPKMEIDEELLKKYAKALADDLMKVNKLDIELDFDETNVKKSSRSKLEKVVSNFYFKIYVDDIYVCESEFYTDRSFDVQFQDFFSVEILPLNKIVTVSLFENNTQASAMNFNISDIKKSITNATSEKVKFIFMHEIPADDKHIGSGNTIKEIGALNKIRLKSSNLFKGKLYTTCETNLNIGWNEDLNKNENEAIIEYKKTEQQIKRLINGTEEISLDTLKNLVEKVYDVDISDNENVIDTLKNLNDTKEDIKYSFEFNEHSDEMIRIKLLRLRSDGNLFDVGNKPIPFHAKQLTTDQLKCLQINEKNYQDLVDLGDDKYLDMDVIEIQRFKRIKHIERLNNSIQKNLHDKLLQKSVRNVVWDFNNLSLSFRNFFARPTMPNTSISNLNAKRHLCEGNDKDFEIQITINKAYNLPERNVSAIVEESAYIDDSIAGFKVKALRPFVRIYYEGNTVQTGTAIGCHPTWNHTLKMKINNRHSALQINIYDEQKEQIADDSQSEQSYQGTLRYRCHNRWLGSLHVPLQSVFTMGKLQGTFKVSTPTYLLGYENVTNAKDKDSNHLIPQVTQLLKKETPFLSMQITLPRNSSTHIPLPNDGDDHAVKHLNKYLEQFLNEFPTRNLNLTSVDSAGKNKCITQFIQPVLLPDYEAFPKNAKRTDSAKSSNISKSSSSKSADGRKSIDVERGLPSPDIERDSIYSGYDKSWKSENDLDRLIDVALRYVSLIPSYEVTAARVVTLTSLELLRTQYGSPLDHNILLASYFLYLGLKTYIAVGLGLPRGSSSYVLTRYDTKSRRMQLSSEGVNEGRGFLTRNEASSWFLFDAVKGERFELRDASCPLKTVDYVFNNENIWVNVQNSQNCEGVSFDLSKSSDWRLVFDKTVFVLKQPIMSDAKLYQLPKSTERLREIIEERVKLKIQKWRTHNKTVWNRYCSSVLREILPHLEYWSLHPASPKPSLGQKLRQMMLTYKTYGFPLNMPFLNRKAITSAIKSSSIHMSDDPNIEFGLAVEVYGYPNDVFSVWVFLVCLSRI